MAGVRRVVLVAVVVLPLVLAGCDKPETALDPASPGIPPTLREEVLRDDLTARLHPQSGPFFPDLWIEDVIEFPEGGNMSLDVGLGVRCEGDATSLAPNGTLGWVTCSLRLASDPAASVESSRRLELGFDYQPLTPRTPAEPVEWRVVVEVDAVNATTNETGHRAVFDSGWRPVDLSPRATPPTVSVTVEDPCDMPDESENPPLLPMHGFAVLNVSFTVLSHAQVRLVIDLGDSVASAPPSAFPIPDGGNVTPHVVQAVFPPWGSEQPMWLVLPVELETYAAPGLVGSGPCAGAVSHEAQTWTVGLTYVGADGSGESFTVDVPVDIYLGARVL